jgi:hypothetical protein
MSRSAWLNVLLAAAVAALGAWIYTKPAKNEDQHALSALKPAEIASIRVERPGEPTMVLAKKQDAWLITAPFAARGDEARVQQLLEIAEAKTVHRYPAADLGRFELVEPQARLILDGQAFSFGMVSPVTREQYVLTNDAVYAVNPRHGALLPVAASDLASPRLFGPGETPARFELGAFTVAQRDGGWRLAPEAAELSQDDFVRWAEAWRHATAARVELHPGYKPSADDIRITLKEGGQIVLGVLSRAPEVTLVRLDEKLKYTFRGATAQRLLAPPGAPAPGKK